MTGTQTTIPFERLEHRGNQLRMLQTLQIPPGPGISAGAAKAVLRVLDDYGRGRACWPAIDTIADAANIGSRTTKRAVQHLQQLGLLAVEKRRNPSGTVGNLYSLVWSEIANAANKTDEERGAMVAERGAMVAERGAMVAERGAMVAPKAPRTDQEPPPQQDPTAAAEILATKTAADILQAAGVYAATTRAREAIRNGWTVEQIGRAAIIADHNRDRLTNPPAALVGFLRTRQWPIDDMRAPPTPEQIERKKHADRIALARRARDRLLWDTRGRPDAEREQHIFRAFQRAGMADALQEIGGPWG